jgi:hypothetical protein
MKELEKLIMALYENNYNLQRSPPPRKSPRYSLYRSLDGPRKTGLGVVDKGNILPLPVI